ncbi:MAG: hypothetical protein WCS01_15870, partial [bacterium]
MHEAHRHVDVLIVTALKEEYYLLPKLFSGEFRRQGFHCKRVDDPQNKRVTHITVDRNGERFLTLAMTHLAGMGNVWAYDETNNLLGSITPRFVLMIGLAGGASDYLNRGDVGYSIGIGY